MKDMKTIFRCALAWTSLFVSYAGLADEAGLSARDEASRGENGHPAEQVVATDSRGNPLKPASGAAPAARASAPVVSREEAGAIFRSTISNVVRESSHIVIKSDAAPLSFRYTRTTQFLDEEGRVVAIDALKSGTSATLYYSRTEGDVVLTKVVVNSFSRGMVGRADHAKTETPFDR